MRGEVGAGFWWGNLKVRDHLGDLGVVGRIMLKWILKIWDKCMDWIDVADGRDTWRALLNALMNLP